jgi:hypothetical protein
MATNGNYIPRPDADFNVWQQNLIVNAQADCKTWLIPSTELDKVVALQSVWNTAYSKASNKQNRTAVDVKAKDDARSDYEGALRVFVAAWLAYNPNVSDIDRARIGISLHSDSHTPVGEPTTYPEASVDFSIHLQHTISFRDAGATNNGKPDGVHACEIWSKMNDATEFSYVGLCTRSPYTVKYNDNMGGKYASYRLRWINPKGVQGPWGTVVTAIIAN